MGANRSVGWGGGLWVRVSVRGIGDVARRAAVELVTPREERACEVSFEVS